MSELNPIRTLPTVQRSMHDYLPRYYEDVPVATNIIDRKAEETASLNADIADVLAQFYIDTATWGLANWERMLGVATDETKPIDQRRSVVKSKIRGIGTVTVGLIQNVAEAYDNGTVSVVEDNANYTVIITFISNRGVPENLADTQSAIREIVPAHLAISFQFTYLRYDELDAQLWTWDTFDGLSFTWDTLEVYKP